MPFLDDYLHFLSPLSFRKHWLIGFPDHKIRNSKNEIVAAPIKPLRLISLGNVHQSAKKKMKDGWRPILIFMQAELEQDLDDMPLPSIDEQFIKMTYDTAMAALQTKAPNLMSGKNEQKHQSWKVATWSRKIREEQLGPTQHRNIVVEPLSPAPVVHTAPRPPDLQPLPSQNNDTQVPSIPPVQV